MPSNYTKRTYTPNPAQVEFHLSNKKYRFYSGGIRSGKTFAGGNEVLYHVVKYPRSAALVVSPTFGMMRDSTLATFMEICPVDLIGRRRDGTLNYNKDTHDIIMYNGSVVRFRSADDPNKIRGMEVSFFWLDEGGQLPDDEMWKIGIGRMSSKAAPHQKAICTTTPNGMNWMYDFFIARKENRGLVSVHYAKTTDNAMNLPKGYIESLESQYTGNFFKQELLGEFVGFEGLVYPEFSVETHVTDNMPRALDLEVNMGMDFGYTDPTVLLAIGKDKQDNRYVYDELHFQGIPLETAKGQIQRFVSKYSPKKIWADPSRADLIRQMELWGFNITKANNDILGGIMAVSHYLKVKSDGKPKLFVHPDCKNLIAEFQMYRYNDKKKGEKPLDKYNHCFVAGTEIATRRGEIPIEDVTVYDEVLTRRGYRKVLRSWMVSDSARVCKFPFGVTCTPEHKIYDSDSNLFIEASAYSNDKHPLMLGDILCTKQSLSDIMDSHIDDTLQWVGQMPSILNESHPREYPNTYIGEYGKTPMEPSPANIISTTKMGTHQITQSKILSAYMAQNTYPPIQRSGRAITKKPSKSIWKGYDHSPKNGTVLPKDLSGTEYTVERCGRTLLLSSASVTNAGRSSMIYRTIVNSALTNASLHGEGTLDSMTHREHVMFAGNHLSSIDTVRQRPAQEVVRESIEPVYDLTIEGVSEYYANGILVHNCLDALRYGVNLPNDVPRNSDRFKNIVGIKRRWKY